ncbi:universal stress protein [Sagittula sp. S175]|uniref:universal stress protein n=1 Tax=Sagittula sp. S175 TaxID=3415129 RepID=UPI003C7A9C10
MYRNILVPLAMDEGSEDRIRKSIAVAEALATEGAKITLLHVMEQVPGYVDTYLPHDYMDELRKALEDRIAQLATEVDGAQGVIVIGHASRGILDYAAANDVDLVVIASHRPGMGDFLIGSTAAQVVRHAQCSVHVLR